MAQWAVAADSSWLKAGRITGLQLPGEVPAKWKRRIARMATTMRNPKCEAEFVPFRDEGVAMFVRAMENVAKEAGGECGAITAMNLKAGCTMMAHGLYWAHKAQENPADRTLALSYANLMNTGRSVLIAAYESEVKLARGRAQVSVDPLEHATRIIDAAPQEPEDSGE